MADSPFEERLSVLINHLQVAVGLAAQRVQRAQGEAMEADGLYDAIRAATHAAHALRPQTGGRQ